MVFDVLILLFRDIIGKFVTVLHALQQSYEIFMAVVTDYPVKVRGTVRFHGAGSAEKADQYSLSLSLWREARYLLRKLTGYT